MSDSDPRPGIHGAAGGIRGRPALVGAGLRVVLALVLAAGAARAAGRIEDAELADAMRELDAAMREQAALERPLHDVVARYRERLERARTGRETAIAHFLLAAALGRAGSRDASVGQLQLAIGEFDDFPLAHLTLGRLYLDEGNLDRARDCFARCRALDPARTEATIALAVTALRGGDAAGAAEARALLEPLHAQGDVPDVASWLAMAHLRRAQSATDAAEARAALERAWTLAVEGLRESPDRDNARAALATVLRARDDEPGFEPGFAAALRNLPAGRATFETVAAIAGVFRPTGRPERGGFWLHVALTSHPALREPGAMRAALESALPGDAADAVLAAASSTCRARLDDDARPLALRRGEALLLRTFYLRALALSGSGDGTSAAEARLVFARLMRLLPSGDPALRAEALRMTIELAQPRMVPLLSMTLEMECAARPVGPNAVLAVRAVAVAGDGMAIPGLLRALSCPSAPARAEAHAQLLRITGTLDPATPMVVPEDAPARWRAFFHDARGADYLREGLERCASEPRRSVDESAWTPVGRALTWHVLTQVLEDGAMPPELWSRAWAAIVARLGEDPRAESRRGAPVDDAERRELAAALRARFEAAGAR